MKKNTFLEEFPSLVCELIEFQYGAMTDEELGRRLIQNHGKNPKSVLIATAKALVNESIKLLHDFDARWEEFVEASNLASLQHKADARAWLEKMNSLWSQTLHELESKNSL